MSTEEMKRTKAWIERNILSECPYCGGLVEYGCDTLFTNAVIIESCGSCEKEFEVEAPRE